MNSSLPVIDHWLISFRFKNEEERVEFHNKVRDHTRSFKNWNFEIAEDCVGQFMGIPIVRISKRVTDA